MNRPSPRNFVQQKGEVNRKRKRSRKGKHSIAGNPQASNNQKASRSKERDRQGAYERLVRYELCMDLAGKFARGSAKATDDDTGTIRLHYERIVTELRCLRETRSGGERRSLSDVIRACYETDDALKQFLPKLGKWIGEYVADCIREHTFVFTALYRQKVPSHTWTLCGHSVSRELLSALAEEYVRDRDSLMGLLGAVFRRWRVLFAPKSLLRVQMVTQQVAPLFKNDRKQILGHLQAIGAIPDNLTVQHTCSWLKRIGQYLSRDQRSAAKKDFGFKRGAEHPWEKAR